MARQLLPGTKNLGCASHQIFRVDRGGPIDEGFRSVEPQLPEYGLHSTLIGEMDVYAFR
jgi:hypothetical protein